MWTCGEIISAQGDAPPPSPKRCTLLGAASGPAEPHEVRLGCLVGNSAFTVCVVRPQGGREQAGSRARGLGSHRKKEKRDAGATPVRGPGWMDPRRGPRQDPLPSCSAHRILGLFSQCTPGREGQSSFLLCLLGADLWARGSGSPFQQGLQCGGVTQRGQRLGGTVIAVS